MQGNTMTAAERAKKMAAAAGLCTAQQLAEAALMLIQLAALAREPEKYFQWLDKQEGKT